MFFYKFINTLYNNLLYIINKNKKYFLIFEIKLLRIVKL